MEEYRKMIDIGPVSLADTDFQELERIVSKDLRADESLKSNYTAEHGTRTVESETITELFAELEQGAVPSEIDASYWIRGQGNTPSCEKHVSVDLRRHTGILRSRLWVSSSDQTWCLGETQLLMEFFRKRHLWYWRIAHGLPYCLSALIGIQTSTLLWSLKSHNVVTAFCSVMLLLVSAIVLVLTDKSVLFPGFVLSGSMSSKPSVLRTSTFWTAIGAIAAAITALVSIASFAVQLLRR
jgi:hypothetical protein